MMASPKIEVIHQLTPDEIDFISGDQNEIHPTPTRTVSDTGSLLK